jgi:hypothetical protein
VRGGQRTGLFQQIIERREQICQHGWFAGRPIKSANRPGLPILCQCQDMCEPIATAILRHVGVVEAGRFHRANRAPQLRNLIGRQLPIGPGTSAGMSDAPIGRNHPRFIKTADSAYALILQDNACRHR